jgi:uncharacterized LabA/DUF88 family protein
LVCAADTIDDLLRALGHMRKSNQESGARSRVLVLVDESNVGSSVRTAGRGLDWLKLRDFLAGPTTGRDLIEMVVYSGLPPAIPTWQDERDRKNKFVHWLRSNGFMVVTKDGAPAEGGHYKANVDVMMAIDALELSIEMRPDVVILVTGDADFAYLATKLRRHGIRVEVASVAANLGNILRSAASDVIDLAPLFRTFEITTFGAGGSAAGATDQSAGYGPAGSESNAAAATARTPASVSSRCYGTTTGRKLTFMGHSKGRDNAKRRARRRKKTERLALAKQSSPEAPARQRGKNAAK